LRHATEKFLYRKIFKPGINGRYRPKEGKYMISRKRAKAITTALFLVGLAILSYTQEWWPGIMLAIGIPLALRHLLLGKYYDMCVSLFVFVGVFLTIEFQISWEILLPVIFTVGAIYILCRDWVESDDEAIDTAELKTPKTQTKAPKAKAAPKKKKKKRTKAA